MTDLVSFPGQTEYDFDPLLTSMHDEAPQPLKVEDSNPSEPTDCITDSSGMHVSSNNIDFTAMINTLEPQQSVLNHAEVVPEEQVNISAPTVYFDHDFYPCKFELHEILSILLLTNVLGQWTTENSLRRGIEILGDNGLSEENLPHEAALLEMPKAPEFPLWLDKFGNQMMSDRIKDRNNTNGRRLVELRDIPWLPYPFNLDEPAWLVSLYMTLGATVDDMAARVTLNNPLANPRSDLTAIRNRILKRSDDWRKEKGGFGRNPKLIQTGKVTQYSEKIIKGGEGREPLTDQQLIFVSKTAIIYLHLLTTT
jgi:hypothetical protein